MAVREKLKSLVKSSKSRGDNLKKTDSDNSLSSRERWPSNVYKPGEPMPRPKYRMPAKKEHTEKLESFSFADAWRRKSFQSTYSPMGTRAPSRRTSFISLGRRSVGNKSMAKSDGRSSSFASTNTEKSVKDHHARPNGLSRLNTTAEAEGDDDVHNVGMSRVQSADAHPPPKSRPLTADGHRPDEANPTINGAPTIVVGTQAHDHQPFTEDDLRRAFTKTELVEPAR